MFQTVKEWWDVRRVTKLATAEMDRFNLELGECRHLLCGMADEAHDRLRGELAELKAAPEFGLDACRETWEIWHDEGDALTEASGEAVHLRLSPYLEFARVMEIEPKFLETIDEALTEWKAYYLLGGADAYATFSKENGLVPAEAD